MYPNATKNNKTNRPMNTLSEIPQPKANAQRVVALVKTGGKITGYKLSDGKVLDKSKAVSLARSGGISGVGIGVRKGSEYLKSLPDGKEKNNLGNLPSVTG